LRTQAGYTHGYLKFAPFGDMQERRRCSITTTTTLGEALTGIISEKRFLFTSFPNYTNGVDFSVTTAYLRSLGVFLCTRNVYRQ